MALNDLDRLLPCPFCGAGQTDIVENGAVWAGTKYSAPISVSVRHWCPHDGQPGRMIERIGRDLESAIAAWNMRANTNLTRAAETANERDADSASR